jgi:flagellum-specific ATP synthase
MNKVVTREHTIVSSHLRDLMAAYKETEDLINVGAYAQGTNPKVDKALIIYEELIEMLKQRIDDSSTIDDLYDQMVNIARKAEAQINPGFLQESPDTSEMDRL